MLYRNFGRTGLKVSPICLGCMMFGGKTEPDESYQIIDRAIDVDINFFDYATYAILDNGDKIFRLKIISSNAYSLNFIFDKFFIPDKGELFLYNIDYSDKAGAHDTFLSRKI